MDKSNRQRTIAATDITTSRANSDDGSAATSVNQHALRFVPPDGPCEKQTGPDDALSFEPFEDPAGLIFLFDVKRGRGDSGTGCEQCNDRDSNDSSRQQRKVPLHENIQWARIVPINLVAVKAY